MKFTKPPIVIKFKDRDLPLRNKEGKIRIEYSGENFPIGKVYEDIVDGYTSTFKVVDHQYIGQDLVAIIVDQVM